MARAVNRMDAREEAAAHLIDLVRYPIDKPASPACRRLVAQCRRRLKATGACALPGFTTPGATAEMAAETDRVAGEAYACRGVHNAYLEKDDPAFPEDHPRRRPQLTSLDVVAYDRIGERDGLRVLYHWDALVDFIADVLERDTLYRMADPLAALTVNVMHEGQNHGWHFDEAEITTTLMLQAPERGGRFEYAPHIRSADDEHYDAVGRVLEGHSPDVRTLDVRAGTLLIFAGYYAIHRVTPVAGNKTRYVATLCFKDRPGVRNSPEVQRLFYGRTA